MKVIKSYVLDDGQVAVVNQTLELSKPAEYQIISGIICESSFDAGPFFEDEINEEE